MLSGVCVGVEATLLPIFVSRGVLGGRTYFFQCLRPRGVCTINFTFL